MGTLSGSVATAAQRGEENDAPLLRPERTPVDRGQDADEHQRHKVLRRRNEVDDALDEVDQKHRAPTFTLDLGLEQAAEKGCEAALRAPRGRMQGAATKAMPGRIGEERRRRRRPRAAATACGGWPFARDTFEARSSLFK